MTESREDLHERIARMNKANHIANWLCHQVDGLDYAVTVDSAYRAVLGSIDAPELWDILCAKAGKPRSSLVVREMVLTELKRRLPPNYPAGEDPADDNVIAFRGLPKE